MFAVIGGKLPTALEPDWVMLGDSSRNDRNVSNSVKGLPVGDRGDCIEHSCRAL